MASRTELPFMARHVLHFILAIVLLGLGGSTARWIVQSAPAAPMRDLPGPGAVPVDTHLLSPRTVSPVVRGMGTLRAAREVQLASELGGRVVRVADGLRRGGLLAAGDLILQTDRRPLELELKAQEAVTELARVSVRAAEADLSGARNSVKIAEERLGILVDEEARWSELVASGKAERARADVVRGQRLAAAGALEEARRLVRAATAAGDLGRAEIQLGEDRKTQLEDRLARCSVTAPYAGRFSCLPGSDRLPSVGDTLAPGVPFGALLDSATLRLITEVHADEVAWLREGQAAMAAPSALPGLLLEGRVTAIGATVDPRTRTVSVATTFEGRGLEALWGGEHAAAVEGAPSTGSGTASNEAPLVLPSGSFARVEITAADIPFALHVDESWIAYRDGEALVYVVEGRDDEGGPIAAARPIEFLPGRFEGGRILKGGVEFGELLITSPLELVGDGARVRLTEMDKR